jgi:hypothetical protein
VPAKYNRTVIRVTTPTDQRRHAPGVHRVSPKDVDDALEQVAQDLEARFTDEVGNPSRVPPGMTVFPDTAVLGDPSRRSTRRRSSAGGRVVHARGHRRGHRAGGRRHAGRGDRRERLGGSVSDGYELVEGSTTVDVGAGAWSTG